MERGDWLGGEEGGWLVGQDVGGSWWEGEEGGRAMYEWHGVPSALKIRGISYVVP